jgi:hydroxymethylpyrimidine kinase/phosphomethylpyrimidine kinase/thiamine-phosphate diphosphorylase
MIETSSYKKIVWTVAGSDSGGGAGLQADLKALACWPVHGCSAVAAITAQNSVAVTRVDAVAPDLIDAQLAALAADLPPAALKTGMLGSAENLRVLVRWIDRLRQSGPLAVVVDPVLRATTGAALANDELRQAYLTELLPRTTLLTPNRAEAAALLGWPALNTSAEVEAASAALRALGAQAVVITGGDAVGGAGGDASASAAHSHDHVDSPHASGWLSAPRVASPHHHGSGCVFASSAAAALALGHVAVDAVVLAKMATAHAIAQGYPAGQGAGPVQPTPGFARQLARLPRMGLPGQGPLGATDPAQAFAPLVSPDLGLYAVVDSAAWVQRVLAAGVRTVQLRVKDPQQPDLHEQVRASVAAARAAGAQLFINDHWALALAEGAYGVHLGQEDLASADLGALARAGVRLGISTHSLWEMCRAWALQPSYVACGPIHATASKDMPWLPQGNGNLAYWSQLLPLPVVGIAGMNTQRLTEAFAHGAAGVALISGITAAPDPEAAVADLLAATTAGQQQQARVPAPPWPRPTLEG